MSLRASLAVFFIVPLIGVAACKNNASDSSSGSNLSKNSAYVGTSARSASSGGSGNTSSAPGSPVELKPPADSEYPTVKAGLLEPNIDGQRG